MTAARPELHVLDRDGLTGFAPARTAVLAASSCGIVSLNAGWAVWRTWTDDASAMSAGHPARCLCCALDRALETALAGLFVDRMRARCAPFDGAVVLAPPGAVARVASACAASALIAGRYALRGMSGTAALRAAS